jgi:hypothetical protein
MSDNARQLSLEIRPKRGAPIGERLAYFSDRSGKCWIWLGKRDREGYGEIRIAVDGRKFHARAHRVSYEHHVGPIPAELEIDHLCGNTGCINPAHLEPVTHAENMRRAWLRRKARKAA